VIPVYYNRVVDTTILPQTIDKRKNERLGDSARYAPSQKLSEKNTLFNQPNPQRIDKRKNERLGHSSASGSCQNLLIYATFLLR
jgi:hypothetical protein